MQELRDLQKKLHSYVNQINDEFGESIDAIYHFINHIQYMNEELKKSVLKEGLHLLKILETEYVWSERTETITIRELIYKEDLE